MEENLIRVVLIDDDKDDYILIKDLLNDVRTFLYSIEWIQSSELGLEALKKQAADIYLVDYKIDAKTGLHLLDEINTHDIKKSIILLTGKGTYEIDVAAMNKGAADFLSKDQITSESLERSIRYCIKRSKDEQKLREIVKLKSEKEASEAANQAKSIFLANMSHEIRTPLGVIMGFTDLAIESQNLSEKNEFLKSIRRNSENLLLLINDILDLSKVEAGHLEACKEFFDWRKLILETLNNLQPRYREKTISVKFLSSGNIPELLFSDPHRLQQVLLNVLSNAIKFTNEGSIQVNCRIETFGEQQKLVIDISDTGIGLSLDDQEKLFRPFQQASHLTCRSYGGTGLGLNLSKKLIHLLDGDLTLLKSCPGVGSTFRIALPANLKRSTISTKFTNPSEGSLFSHEPQRRFKVLLVEDDLENQIIVKHFLKNTPFEIECALDGEQGLQKALHGNYDVVLMDIQMPKLDGYETTKKLRLAKFSKPIIALTAHALKEEKQLAFQKGFSEYLTKPIQKKTLVSMLSSFTEQSPCAGKTPNLH